MAGMGGDPQVYTQDSYRGRNDLFEESVDDGWFFPTNVDWDHSLDLDDVWRLRIGIRRDAHDGSSNEPFRLHYSHNEGSFTEVNTNSSVIRSVLSGIPGYDDDDDSTQLITAGVYTANNNAIAVNTSIINTLWDASVGADSFVETEWTLRLISADVASGDTIEFRLRKGAGGAIDGGYEQVPIITILPASRIKIKSGTLLIKSGTSLIK